VEVHVLTNQLAGSNPIQIKRGRRDTDILLDDPKAACATMAICIVRQAPAAGCHTFRLGRDFRGDEGQIRFFKILFCLVSPAILLDRKLVWYSGAEPKSTTIQPAESDKI
jgi:hypothetical protein